MSETAIGATIFAVGTIFGMTIVAFGPDVLAYKESRGKRGS